MFRKKVLITFITLGLFFLSFLILETGLRIYFHFVKNYDIEMWEYAKYLKQPVKDGRSHTHKPDSSANIMGEEVKINSKGLRDDEYSYQKPENTYRILLIGSSSGFGFGVKKEETYSERIEKALNEKYKDGKIKYEVINSAIGNYNTGQETAFLKIEGYKYHPDHIFLQWYINDAEATQKYPDNFFTRNSITYTFLMALKNNLVAYVNKNKNFENYYCSLYAGEKWDDYEKKLESFLEEVKLTGAKLTVFITPELHNLNNYPFSDIQKKVADFFKNKGYEAIDAAPAFLNKNPEDFWVARDDQHPNSEAHKLTVEYLLNNIGL